MKISPALPPTHLVVAKQMRDRASFGDITTSLKELLLTWANVLEGTTVTSLHCDAGEHDKCFWTGKPDSAYPERSYKRCRCECHTSMAEPQITVFACPPRCEHVMDSERTFDNITSRACSNCGATAFDISMMEGI